MRAFARSYAQAALAVAGSLEEASLVRDQLGAFAATLHSSAQLRTVVVHPALPAETKRAVVERVAERLGLGALTRRLLLALAQRHRLGRLDEVIAALTAEIHARQGIAVAAVRTAEPLGDDERAGLQRVLEAKVGKKLQLRTAVEPALLAGFVAQVESELFDCSLRGQLERLAKELAEA